MDWQKYKRTVTDWLAGTDLLVLLAGLVVVAGAWGFFVIADEVTEGDLHHLDANILRSLRDPDDPHRAIGPEWLKETMRDVTALGGFPVLTLVVLAVAGFLLLCRTYHALVLMLAATVGGALLSVVLKDYFARPRPDLVPHFTAVNSPSFPSGHSMLSAVVFLTLGALLARLVPQRRLKLYALAVALLLTLLIGVSRVYLGVHYPTDVLAGWTAGLTWAVGCWLAARALQRRGAVEQDIEPPNGKGTVTG